jgi:hypothetical protein
MWPEDYAGRLRSWMDLRERVRCLDLVECLKEINHWWFAAPWCNYSLHWDDVDSWPDPWQLLEDHRYCAIARGLGMLYTITMLERSDTMDAVLAEFGSTDLVSVSAGKYILNWVPDSVVNIDPGAFNPQRSMSQRTVLSKIN